MLTVLWQISLLCQLLLLFKMGLDLAIKDAVEVKLLARKSTPRAIVVESWAFFSNCQAKTLGRDVILYAVLKTTKEY